MIAGTPGNEEQQQSALGGIALFTLAKLVFHLIVNVGYGFHRDELQTLDDARHLAWGYVAYPPLTPFLGRVELMLFGTSLTGFRSLAAVAQCVVILLAALLARRLGGSRSAQWLAAIAVAISPVSLAASSLFQYVSFDFLWWVAIAWMLASLVASGDERWWLGIGAAIGLGVMTKYTMVFLVAGVVTGVLLTSLRRHLLSRWLWGGVALSLVIAAPNLVWQLRHDFISLDFLQHIHARDVRIGRTANFLVEQLYVSANAVTIPLWVTGAVALFFSQRMRRFRLLGVAALVPFVLFLAAGGRGYYTAPLFVTLIAAGSVIVADWSASLRPSARRAVIASVVLLLLAGSGVVAVTTPLARPGTKLWKFALDVNGDFREELGWRELAGEVARIWSSLSENERQETGVFAGNYGEAGAINLYGPDLGLPRAMSGVNSFWYRGYDVPSPRNMIVLGASRDDLSGLCGSVEKVGTSGNAWDVANEESTSHRDIFLCRGLTLPIEKVWPRVRSFG